MIATLGVWICMFTIDLFINDLISDEIYILIEISSFNWAEQDKLAGEPHWDR